MIKPTLLYKLFFALAFPAAISGHMTLEVPASRDLANNNNNPAKQPCGTYPKGNIVATYKAGQSVPVKLKGSAVHGNGGCVFSLSYDNATTFKVIHVTDESCPTTNSFQVKIPENAPSCDSCIFAWSWVPVTSGQPEHYFQCADIKIEGSGYGTLQGVDLPFYNLDGGKKHFGDAGGQTSPWVKLPEFANYQNNNVRKDSTPTTTASSSTTSSSSASNSTTNTPSSTAPKAKTKKCKSKKAPSSHHYYT